MLESLKSLDIFKNSASSTSSASYQPSTNHLNHSSVPSTTRLQPNPLYPAPQHPRPYPTRFTGFPFPTPFDHRRFYTLGEFYLSQQLERSSAFQYVQANHLRNLSNVAGNFINRPVVPSPIVPLPVKWQNILRPVPRIALTSTVTATTSISQEITAVNPLSAAATASVLPHSNPTNNSNTNLPPISTFNWLPNATNVSTNSSTRLDFEDV